MKSNKMLHNTARSGPIHAAFVLLPFHVAVGFVYCDLFVVMLILLSKLNRDTTQHSNHVASHLTIPTPP
jgi:hypothetical protein